MNTEKRYSTLKGFVQYVKPCTPADGEWHVMLSCYGSRASAEPLHRLLQSLNTQELEVRVTFEQEQSPADTIRRLEAENADLRARMEQSKLRGSPIDLAPFAILAPFPDGCEHGTRGCHGKGEKHACWVPGAV